MRKKVKIMIDEWRDMLEECREGVYPDESRVKKLWEDIQKLPMEDDFRSVFEDLYFVFSDFLAQPSGLHVRFEDVADELNKVTFLYNSTSEK